MNQNCQAFFYDISCVSKHRLLISLFFFFNILLNFICIQAQEQPENKTILLAILAKDKAHVLPLFLDCIEKLDYEKSLISIYINTNNNVDNTQELLEDWVKRKEHQYHRIIFEGYNLPNIEATAPHQWTTERFKILGGIRNKSLEVAKEEKTDFYFVVDCDNFITPCTLKELVRKDKPIIAPLLKSTQPFDAYCNFFGAVSESGYYVQDPVFEKIRQHEMVGIFKVPVVHCTYLIKSEYLERLNYIDDTNDFEFAIFSRIARQKNIDQYICNEKNFGILLHFFDAPTLEEESQRYNEEEFQRMLIKELSEVYTYPIDSNAAGLDLREKAKWYCLLKGFIFSPSIISFTKIVKVDLHSTF